MTIVIIYLVISFILDGYMSLVFNYDLYSFSLFKTIYTLIALIVLRGFITNKKKYFSLFIFSGILFDMVYSKTLLLNLFIYLVIYFIMEHINYLIPSNIVTVYLKSYIGIFLYHLLTYFILLLTSNIYPFSLLVKILLENIIMTFVYSMFTYLLLNKLFTNKRIK